MYIQNREVEVELATEDTLAAAVVVKEDNRPMAADNRPMATDNRLMAADNLPLAAAFDQASYLGFGSPSMATPYSLSFAAD